MKKFLLLSFTLLILAPQVVAAQGIKNALNPLQQVGGPTGESADLAVITGTVIRAALTLVGLIFLVLMVYAGYTWMLARGDEAEVKKAQDIIKACMIGLVIVVSAYAITVFVTTKLGG